MIKVLLCDDHPVVREGVSVVLGLDGDFDIVSLGTMRSAAVGEGRVHASLVASSDVRPPAPRVNDTRRRGSRGRAEGKEVPA